MADAYSFMLDEANQGGVASRKEVEGKTITSTELSAHKTPADCWIVLEGSVYDVTEFARTHVGGTAVITRHGGQDATAAFKKRHDLVLLQGLKPYLLGTFQESSKL